jgi:hypothetical protein
MRAGPADSHLIQHLQRRFTRAGATDGSPEVMNRRVRGPARNRTIERCARRSAPSCRNSTAISMPATAASHPLLSRARFGSLGACAPCRS